MKVHYRSKSGRLVFEIEGQSLKQMFHGIADVQEVFEAESTCGCCGSQSLRFRVRNNQDNDYYEMLCDDCTATFAFGQTKQGNKLFPRRKDKDDFALPDRGWKVWQRREIPAAAEARPAPKEKEKDELPF
jgi:hypothetical protein